jgi:hypothetical protein
MVRRFKYIYVLLGMVLAAGCQTTASSDDGDAENAELSEEGDPIEEEDYEDYEDEVEEQVAVVKKQKERVREVAIKRTPSSIDRGSQMTMPANFSIGSAGNSCDTARLKAERAASNGNYLLINLKATADGSGPDVGYLRVRGNSKKLVDVWFCSEYHSYFYIESDDAWDWFSAYKENRAVGIYNNSVTMTNQVKLIADKGGYFNFKVSFQVEQEGASVGDGEFFVELKK